MPTLRIDATEGPQPCAGPGHSVQFYEDEESLYSVVGDFLADGLRAGEAVVVIATPEHRDAFLAAVTAKEIDADMAIRSGELILIDARDALATCMAGDMPDEQKFQEVIGGVIDEAAGAWKESRVRAYGEMVDVLWRDGNPEAAIRLEELWNDLIIARSISLLCAYSMGNFYKEAHSRQFTEVCEKHTSVFLPETSVLEQRARSLTAEVEHRKELEKALREALAARRKAEEQLKDFVENAPIGLHWVGPDGTILWANDAELKLLGYAREEYVGGNIRDFYVDRSEVEVILGRLSANEEIHDREVRLRASDGSTRDVVVTSNARFDEGRFVHTRCFTRDVSDKRTTEHQLRVAEEKFRRLFDSNIIGIFTRTADGRILEANEPYLRLVGYNREDLQAGLRWTDLTPSEYRPKDEAAIAEIQERGECTPYEKEYIRKDGTRVPILVGAARLNGGETHIAYVIDLTERKTAERDSAFLAEASEIVARTLDSSAVLESIAQLFVPRLADVCFVDIRRDDGTLERTAIAFKAPGDPEIAASVQCSEFAKAQISEDGRFMTVPLIARDATFGFIGFLGTGTRRPFNIHDLALAVEVARRAALAVDNAKLYEAAQSANRAKDEFLATLSHELRTPMTAILGWSRFLRIGTVDPETMANAIDAINRAAVAQAQLIDDVLDMSRIVSGKLRLEIQPVDLAGVIEAAVETVRPAMVAKEINLKVKRDESAGLVWADPSRLQQALWNLLTNAAKFTESGGTVIVETRRVGKTSRIIVRDSGQGIAPDFLPYVFERFRQAESNSTRSFGGLGLGLAIVRYIVEMHGGRVTAASDGIGKGAAFTIELPVTGDTKLVSNQPVRQEEYCDLGGTRVLFVDDQPEARTFVRAVLEHCGAEVKDCASSSDALITVRDWRPDVVITDIAMPGEDGHTLVRRLNERDWGETTMPPIIALTAYGKAHHNGDFAEYLTKPIDPLVLAQAVRRAAAR